MRKIYITFLTVSIFLTWKAFAQSPDVEQLCEGAQESCSACLSAHPECAWCSSNATSSSARCRPASVIETNCPAEFRQSPRSSVIVTRNNDFSMVESSITPNSAVNVTQLRPQAAQVQIREGDTQVVNITFRRVVDYPLDLYYVMDLSNSMRDDLQTLQGLGISLASEIRDVTSNFRLGFGTFVDKPMMPYASTVPELLQNPCLRSENQTCAPVFGFRHQLSLTDRYEEFELEVNKTEISGNIDSPEGGFDALMQIAVCGQQIGWNDDALRVIIFTTDASSHIAMDGKLAAILEANDMQCHLERESTGSWIYSKSRFQDYPSIGQLKRVFEANKIQTIFAVTRDVRPLYADLPGLLERASVPVLNSDSSNVVEIIRNQYNLLRSAIQLNPPNVPSNIEMSFRSLCPGINGEPSQWVPNSLQCENVGIGEEVVFQFSLTARGCPSNPDQVDNIEITSSSIVDRVALSVEYVSCQCECFKNRRENSPQCSGAGTYECGLCYCNKGATGQQCQCTALSSGEAVESQCVPNPLEYQPNDILCNNLGTCECGVCSCQDGVFGKACECSRNGCPNDCGGFERGTCQNCNGDQRCQCNTNRGWTFNSRIGDCSCNVASCTAPNTTLVCSGRGTCQCDECACQSSFSGRFCNRCEHPDCTGITDGCNGLELRTCAECVYEANRVDKTAASECDEECTQRGIRFIYQEVYQEDLLDCETCVVDCEMCTYLSPNSSIHVPKLCRSTHIQTECDVTYKIFWNSNLHAFVVYVRRHNVEEDCPGSVDPLLIVLPVVGGIVLLGLIALILWKIFQTIRDKHEYENFLEEAKRSQWKTNENPLFEKPTDRIENPAYIGAK